MAVGTLLVAMVILPGAGGAREAYQAIAPGYNRALQLLDKTENAAKTGSRRCPDGGWTYLRKKREYGRFLDNYIAEKKTAFEDEGLSISVISENDLLFLKGYGYADKEALTPATPLTLYCVGSVSKLFTGIAVMQLVEQGRIDLDAPLETYIPDFGYKTHFPDAGPITVRTLMTHQSGIVGDILKGGKLFGRRILRQSTLEQMFVQQNSEIEFDFPDDHGARWGLSWVLSDPALSYAGKYVGHSGHIPNYSAQMHILPEYGLAVIVETNSLQVQQISLDIADMAMMKALEIFKGIKRPDPQPLPPIVPLTPQHIAQTAGTYATSDLGTLSIYPKNSGLFVSLNELGNLELELLPHEDDWFSLYLNGQPAPGIENIRIIVKNFAGKRFAGLQIRTASGLIYSIPLGCEYQIPDELPPEWVNRAGQYNVINPDP